MRKGQAKWSGHTESSKKALIEEIALLCRTDRFWGKFPIKGLRQTCSMDLLEKLASETHSNTQRFRPMRVFWCRVRRTRCLRKKIDNAAGEPMTVDNAKVAQQP